MPLGWTPRRPNLATGIRAVAVAIGLGIPTFVASSIHQQYRQDLHTAETHTANTARALEAHAARTIETVDIYLQAVISLIGTHLDSLSPEEVHGALRDRLAHSQQLTNISILDANGDVLHEAKAFPARSFDRNDHDYLRMLRADPNLGLFVGAPMIGRVSERRILPLARRINRPDGSFAGVILATLEAAAFQSVFDAFDLGAGSSLTLWRADGTMLVRSPHVPAMIGKSYAATENYRRYVMPRDVRPFWAVSAADGVERVIALGFVPNYPLYVSATQARRTALAGWRQTAFAQGSIGGGLTLVLVVALLALAREIQRRQRGDIQLREAERSARASTDLLRTTLDSMEQGLIEIDAGGIVRVCNRRARGLLGLPDDLMAGSPTFRGVLEWQRGHGDLAAAAELGRLPSDGGVAGDAAPFERACRDGTILEVRTTALDHGGAVRTYTDITQRRRGEQAIRESEARYRLLADTATDMIVLTDLDIVRLYVSPASRDLLGYEPEELVGTRVVATGHPDDAARMADTFAALRDGAIDKASITNRIRRKDGSYVWVEAKLHLLRDDEAGRPSGIICAVRDISERQKKAEELRVAKEEAEAGARAKGEFLASMSHELRTPLNSIIGFSGLIVDGDEMPPATIRRYARLMRDASITLLSIVNDVLDVSKMEAGGLELDPHAFALRDVVEGAAALLRSTAEEKGLDLQVTVDPSVPPVVIGDAARLRQVMLNLLSNAVKFTAKGSVRLTVRREGGSAGGPAALRFAVADTGIGIPAGRRDRLFQRFSQIDSSTARRFGGTGLGLSICKSLVALMGGTISVVSTEGGGSTFSFVLDLPVGTAVASAADQEWSGPAAAQADGAHILLAEDVAMNQELAVALLSRWGHTVDVVADGAAAVDAVMQSPYDLVLMDLQMPVMDGLEATRRIRRLGGGLATLPIVAMTANVMEQDVSQCREAGADDHIGKPFVPAKLRAVVEHWAAFSKRTSTGMPAADDARKRSARA